MQCRRPFGAAVPPCGGRPGIRWPCGQRERCRRTWCRQSAARFLAARLRSAFGGPALRGRAIPAGHAFPPRHAVLLGMQSRKSAIRQSPHLGGTAGPIGPAEWCRLLAARSMVPPIGGTASGAAQRGGAKPPGKGQAQNRRRPCCPPARSGRRERCRQSAARYGAARLGGTGNGACNCRHGMVLAKAGTEYGAAYWRHGVMSRLAVRRSHSCRISWRPVSHLSGSDAASAARDVVFPGGQCRIYWKFLCVRVLARAARFPGGRREAMPSFGGMRRWPIGRRERCRAIARHGVWCRPIGRHGTVLPFGSTCRRLNSGGGQQSRRPIGRHQRGGGA